MLKILTKIALVSFVIVLLILPGCVSQKQTTPKNIAMLFDSPVANDAFSLTCLKGAEKAKKQFGIGLAFYETGTDIETGNLLDQLATSRNYDLVICVGATQVPILRKTAANNPKQNFASVDGDIADMKNVSSLLARDNESSFLVGAHAAMMTKTGKIGFIGGMDIPSIHRFLAGYQAGAQYIKPNCKVLTTYVGNWINDGKSKDLAIQQIEQGADILFGAAGAGSLGVIEAAKEKGIYALGVDTDQSPAAPQTVLSSAVKNVDVLVYEDIAKLVEGKFSGGIESVGLMEGGVGIIINSSISSITPEIKTKLADIERKIAAGEIKVPDK